MDGLTPLLLSAVMAASGAAAGGERVRVEIGALTLEAPAELSARMEALAREAGPALERVSSELGARPAAPYRIFLIPGGALSDPEMARLDASAPAWAAGYLLPELRVGAIRVREAGRYPYSDLLSVLVHESVHMLLHDAAGRRLPRWFGEGVATRVGRSWGPRDALVYVTGLLTGGLPALEEMDRSFGASGGEARVAYAASFDFVSWAARRHGEDAIRRVIAEARTRRFADAWVVATGVSLARDEAAWRRGSLLRYRWIPALTGTTTLWIGITLLFFMAIARRRARSREILERWDREAVPFDDPPVPPAAPGSPTVH